VTKVFGKNSNKLKLLSRRN